MAERQDDQSELKPYRIKQYELYVAAFVVEARSKAEAIVKRLGGEGQVCGELEYVGVHRERGLPVCHVTELAEELQSLGIEFRDGILPSISCVGRETTASEVQDPYRWLTDGLAHLRALSRCLEHLHTVHDRKQELAEAVHEALRETRPLLKALGDEPLPPKFDALLTFIPEQLELFGYLVSKLCEEVTSRKRSVAAEVENRENDQ